MGNCVYHVGPAARHAGDARTASSPGPTQALYDARELAMERMQAEAEALNAEGIVGVTVDETNHTWGPSVLEFSAVGTAVVAIRADHQIPRPHARPHGERLMARPPSIDLRAEPRAASRAAASRSAPSERLAEEAGPHSKLFTSDLSVNEFLLARDAGCEPIAQVMGSSIYHIGQIPDYKGKTGEITVISDGAPRVAARSRSRASAQEAALVGADAVIGVAAARAHDHHGRARQGRRRRRRGDRVHRRRHRGARAVDDAPAGPAHRHRSVGPGSLGARAGRLRAVRLPLRVLPYHGWHVTLGHRAASGELDERQRGRRDRAQDRRRTA